MTPLISSLSFSPSTESRPTLQYLQALPASRGDIKVIEAIAAKWKLVGISLSVTSDRIDIIEADNPHRVEEACLQMLQWWLDHHRRPSWKSLIKALRNVNLNVLAHDIESNAFW